MMLLKQDRAVVVFALVISSSDCWL